MPATKKTAPGATRTAFAPMTGCNRSTSSAIKRGLKMPIQATKSVQDAVRYAPRRPAWPTDPTPALPAGTTDVRAETAAPGLRRMRVHLIVSTEVLRNGTKVDAAACGAVIPHERVQWGQRRDGTEVGRRRGVPVLCPACEAVQIAYEAVTR